MKKSLLLLTFGLLFFDQTFGQIRDAKPKEKQDSDTSLLKEDILKPRVNPRVAFKNEFQYGLDSFHTQDSSFVNFHRFNPVYKNFTGVQDLGFTGSAYKSLLFTRNKEAGFTIGENSLNHMLRTSKKTEYYEAQVPFTRFYYTQGKEAMINLNAFHTQNILPNWNVAADYSSFKSDGIYLRQAQKIKTTQVSSKYSTLNGRYLIAGSFNWNRVTSQESGGIVSDSLFENANNLDKNVPNNLTLAQNNIKTREHNIYHHIKLGKSVPLFREKDTITTIEKGILLFHEMDWNQYVYNYTDENPNEDFYHQPFFFTPGVTADSTTYKILKNKVGITIPIGLKDYIGGIRLFSDYEFINIEQGDSQLRRYNNTGIGSRIDIERSSRILNKLNLYGKYVLEGINKNDVELKFNSSIYSDSLYSLGANISYTSLSPYFSQNRITSNHYFWSNDFDKENHTSFNIYLERKSKFVNAKISYGQDLLSNYIYYDTVSQPQQEIFNPISIHNIGLSLNFKIGNFIFNNQVNYQKLSNDKYLHLPEIVSSHQLFYERFTFKEALKLQVGVELFYNSSYLSDMYNPAIRQFYLQDKLETGNYPLMNIFLNAQIKTMKIYVQFEHLNQALKLSGQRYYGTVHQPITPSRLVLGVGWNLFY
jgi:hypothetical protein